MAIPVMSASYIRGRAYELKVHREWANEYVLKLKTLRRAIYTELAPVRRTVIQDRSNVSVNIYFKQINFALTSVFYRLLVKLSINLSWGQLFYFLIGCCWLKFL